MFAQKLRLAFGAGLAGVALELFGFAANEVQTATSLTGIRFMFSIMPALLALAGAAAIYFYRIDSKMIATFERELIERHSA